jgi:hypothetical protein
MNTPIVASLSGAIFNRVGPPSGLLARIRWLFLLCALFNVVAVAPLLLRGEVGSPAMRVAGFLERLLAHASDPPRQRTSSPRY